ncbi:MAG: hypothetical protein AB9866_29930 [Syntrophobacteraceae bacterium]
MSKCKKCDASIEPPDTYEFAGESLCEDCYLEQRIKPITCDPWAVYNARHIKGTTPQLTGTQERILNLIKAKGPLEAPEICRDLGISEMQFQNNFASLRHMELAKAFKDDDKVCYTVF